MSEVNTKSPKPCGKKKSINISKRFKNLIYAFSTLILSILIILLLLWLLLHPTKPEFTLKEADIYKLNLSSPTTVHNNNQTLNSSSTTIQFTLLSKNLNKKVGIYYDNIQVFATYKDRHVTTSSSLPPFYQDHDESNLLSASLAATGLDRTEGQVVLSLKMNGKLRWKIGTWVSGQYRFSVNCNTTIGVEEEAGSPAAMPSSSLMGTLDEQGTMPSSSLTGTLDEQGTTSSLCSTTI